MTNIILKLSLLFLLSNLTIQTLYTNELKSEVLSIKPDIDYVYNIPVPYPICQIKTATNQSDFGHMKASAPVLNEIAYSKYNHNVNDMLSMIIIGNFTYMMDINFGLQIYKIAENKSNGGKTLIYYTYTPNSYNISFDNGSKFTWKYHEKADILIAIYGKILFLYQRVSTGYPQYTPNKQVYFLPNDYVEEGGGIAYYSNNIYIANGKNGILIYDVNELINNNNDGNLSINRLSLASLNMNNECRIVDIAFDGAIGYILDKRNGIFIYNFNDKNNITKINNLHLNGGEKLKLSNSSIIVKGSTIDNQMEYIAEFLRFSAGDREYAFIGPIIYNDNSDIVEFNAGQKYILVLNANILTVYYHSISPLIQPNISDYNYMAIMQSVNHAVFYDEMDSQGNLHSYIIATKDSGYSIYDVIDTYGTLSFNAKELSKTQNMNMMFTYYTLTCPQKILSNDDSAHTLCLYTQEFNIMIEENSTNQPDITLLVGVIGAGIAIILTCIFTWCYVKKIKKKYEELNELPQNNQQAADTGKITQPSEIILKEGNGGGEHNTKPGRKRRPAPLDMDLIESNKRTFPKVMPRLLKLEKRRREQERREKEKREEEEKKAQALREKQRNDHHQISNDDGIDLDSIYVDN